MSKNKFNRFEYERFEVNVKDFNVTDVNVKTGFEISAFDTPKISKPGDGDYQHTREKFGVRASTDPKNEAVQVKDSRFKINIVSKKSLSVQEEEMRYIEERVQIELQKVKDEAREKASKDGFEAGIQKGYEACHKKFQEEGSERLKNFDVVLDALENAKKRIFQANEDFLVEMIYRIGKQLALQELKTDRGYVVRLANEVVQRVALHENIRIRLNQADMESVKYIKEGLEKTLGQLKNINIEASDEVRVGGILVDTEWSAIDARIERQIQGIYQALQIDQKSGKPIDSLAIPSEEDSSQKSDPSKAS